MRKSSLARLACPAAAALLITVGGGASQGLHRDPFAFLAPWVVMSDSERRRLDHDEVVARTLDAGDRQLAVFVATRLNAPPEALVAWTRAIAALKQSRFVPAVGRFSDPPTLSDLDRLTLDERDLEAIRQCVPGDCGLKLSAPEIKSLRAVAASGKTGWQQAVQIEFRRLLVARVNAYRAGGLAALPPSADRETPPRFDQAFTAIMERSPYLTRLPDFAGWLRPSPKSSAANVESFFYWSNEHYGRGKPVISVTHVGIVRQELDSEFPAVLIAAKQIFATHYLEGALGLTMVMRDATNDTQYLVYLNRSQLDVLRGFFGGLARGVLEGRLRRDAPQVVRGLRARLESGNPHDETHTFSRTPP